jgi:hypothetical protein
MNLKKMTLTLATALLTSNAFAAIPEEEFNLHWQRPMSEAFPYFIDQANAAEAKLKSTSIRYELAYGEVAEGFHLSPRFDSAGSLVYKIEIDAKLANNPLVALEALTLIRGFSSVDGLKITIGREGNSVFDQLVVPGVGFRAVTNPHDWAELQLNANAGQKLAQREVSALQLEAFRQLYSTAIIAFMSSAGQRGEPEILSHINQLAAFHGLAISEGSSGVQAAKEYLSMRAQQLDMELVRITPGAKAELRENLLASANSEELKKSAESSVEKLDALVLKNDREGVARLIESFLPWPDMGAIETGMWLNWIEAIRHPRADKSVLAFRGIEGDEKYLKSPKDEKMALISTLLSRNQGNYTRRLRSLKTMRLRFGISNIWGRKKPISPLEGTPKLLSMMSNHSAVPTGSPFLSFTPNLEVAANFAQGGSVIVAKIDQRRLLPNISSRVKSEAEMFVPLIVFPDEILHVQRLGQHRPEALLAIQQFVAKYQAETHVEIATGVSEGYKQFYQAVNRGIKAPACRNAFAR